ncbi:unnamed protein product [marine sediment metagenome]|uniref:Uncharacterized protein n=1 Tax=marine sediment metagenome TaxID=412755 RepID=X0ZAF5_9ZZZZ
MGLGGQIGFDEGGVLQALSKPFMQRETITYEYNKQGLIIAQHTDKFDVSMAHVCFK